MSKAALFMEFDPQVQHHFGGGVYAKQMRIPTGCTIVQHKHTHDHLSVLASGEVQLMVDGAVSRYTAPACIHIAADRHHAVHALTDAVWYCIHATDCTDPEQVDEVIIKRN
jgi:quercetin dioxygenase-like cupin family protein